MKIKTWNLFLESLESEMTPEILKLIEETKRKAEENGVEIIMEETKTVPYAIGDFPVS